MGKGGVHFGSPYMFSMIGKGGIRAKCNLDLLDSMAFTLTSLVGPWIIAGDWNCTPEDLRATGWLQKLGGVIHAPSAPPVPDKYTTSSLWQSAYLPECRAHMSSVMQGLRHTPFLD